MAKADEPKKPGQGGDGQPPGVSETILEQQRDPDEAVFAEQAILHYVHWVLEQFQPQLENAIDSFAAWLRSQADVQLFNNHGFFAQITESFLQQMGELFGGAKAPIAEQLLPVMADPLDESQRQQSEVSFFVTDMQRSARDACWYLRDNAQSLLSNQWDQLRDLAYEGSTEFIPVIHQMGLPSAEWNGVELTQSLMAEAERFRALVPMQKEEVEQQTGIKPEGEEAEKKEEAAEQDKALFQEEEKAQAV